MFVGVGTDFWGNSIFVLPQNLLLLEAEFLNTSIKIFPVCLSLLGATSAFVLYNFFFKLIYQFKLSFIGRHLYIFFNRKWFFDKIYNYVFANHILVWGYRHAYQNIDRGLIEFLGPTGIWLFINNNSMFINTFLNQNVFTINRLRIMFKSINILLWGIFFLSLYTLYFTKNLGFFETFFTKNLILENFLLEKFSLQATPNFFQNLIAFQEIESNKQQGTFYELAWKDNYANILIYSAFLQENALLNTSVEYSPHFIKVTDLALHLIGRSLGVSPFPTILLENGKVIQNQLIQLPENVTNFFGDIIPKKQFFLEINAQLSNDLWIPDKRIFNVNLFLDEKLQNSRLSHTMLFHKNWFYQHGGIFCPVNGFKPGFFVHHQQFENLENPFTLFLNYCSQRDALLGIKITTLLKIIFKEEIWGQIGQGCPIDY
jgi:hypothetical protein